MPTVTQRRCKKVLHELEMSNGEKVTKFLGSNPEQLKKTLLSYIREKVRGTWTRQLSAAPSHVTPVTGTKFLTEPDKQ
jgi:hypothetical protein